MTILLTLLGLVAAFAITLQLGAPKPRPVPVPRKVAQDQRGSLGRRP